MMDSTITRPAPAPTHPSAHWKAVAAELRAHDAQWRTVSTAVSSNAARSLAYDIRSGRKAAFRPAGTFEAVAVGLDVRARLATPPSSTAPPAPS